MGSKFTSTINKWSKQILISSLFIAAITALSGAIIMTDIGQLFGIAKSWIVWYFSNKILLLIISLVFLGIAVFINWKHTFLKKWIMIVLCCLWVGAFLASFYLVPYLMFPAKQNNAKYVAIHELSEDYLEDEDIVFVLDYNGEQKAYPPEYMWQSHIFGGDFGDENVVFTYCVIANLPSPYIDNVDGKEVNFRVLAQTNSNLLIWDTESDEIIQQITQKYEFSERKLNPVAVMEMTWRGFKKLFPEGEVLFNEWNTPMEKILSKIMTTEDIVYGEDWMFKTANLDDTRLPSKEQIMGIRDDALNKQLAVTKGYIKQNGICNLSVGNQHVALVHFPEYDAFMAFDRMKNGEEIAVEEIDPLGNTPKNGKLDRIYVYNSVLWAVWAYYYPESEVLK